jgi:hypothetical protein
VVWGLGKKRIDAEFEMKKATVYFFEKFDAITGRNVRSERPAILETITRVNGQPIMETALEVDEAELDGNGFRRQRQN